MLHCNNDDALQCFQLLGVRPGCSPEPLPAAGSPAAGYWPASLRSLTFLQSKSQALDVELRSCSLNERRSFSLAELRLLDVIANPPLGHNNSILSWPQPPPQKINSVQVCGRGADKPASSPGRVSNLLLITAPTVTLAAAAAASWTHESKLWREKVKHIPSLAATSHSKKKRKSDSKAAGQAFTPHARCACVPLCVCAFVERFTRSKRRDAFKGCGECQHRSSWASHPTLPRDEPTPCEMLCACGDDEDEDNSCRFLFFFWYF